MERRIVSTTILVEWSDNPKPVVLNNDMPNGLANDFDDWLTEIEEEEQARLMASYKSFIDDKEKMRDFYILSKQEFLQSYSYLTELEYDLTVQEQDNE